MRRIVVSGLAVLVVCVGAIVVTPAPCAACPPLTWDTEMVTLSIESVSVDGVDVPTPSVYWDVEARLFPARIDPSQLWLQIQVDSSNVYFAAFR